jgi:flagellar biogenesis protein FliO
MVRFLLLLLLLPGTAWCAAPPPATTMTGSLRLLAGMACVAGLMLAGYALLRRFGRWFPNASDSVIRIRETRALGPNKSLCLGEVQGRRLLLGITAERITLLEHLPAPDEAFANALEQSGKEPA